MMRLFKVAGYSIEAMERLVMNFRTIDSQKAEGASAFGVDPDSILFSL